METQDSDDSSRSKKTSTLLTVEKNDLGIQKFNTLCLYYLIKENPKECTNIPNQQVNF